jgi:hypothetical protein
MATKKQSIPKPARGKRASTSVKRMLHSLKSGGDFRSTKVRRLRAAVRAKRYENDLKLSIAADRLIASITGG